MLFLLSDAAQLQCGAAAFAMVFPMVAPSTVDAEVAPGGFSLPELLFLRARPYGIWLASSSPVTDTPRKVEAMPGDPKECRQHAENCLRLAKEATTEEARKTFAELANKWMMLAGDLESAQALLDVARDRLKQEG